MAGTTYLKTMAAAAAVALLSSAATTAAASAASVAATDGVISLPLVPHHEQRRRLGLPEQTDEPEDRRLGNRHNKNRQRRTLVDTTEAQTNAEKQIMSQLYMGYGTHYVDLWCGSPPQRQTVIVDTGSTFTAFPGEECKDCGYPKYHIDDYFRESRSSTFETWGCDECSQRTTCNTENDRCEMDQYYSEGSSWTAYEAIDTCYIGGFHNKVAKEDEYYRTEDIDPTHAVDYAFATRIAIQTELTGLFKTQLADGIMGMSDSKQAFWHQMYRHHMIKYKQFSLCYVRPPHAYREGSKAGAITIGGTDERLHDTTMVFTTTSGTSSEKAINDKTGYYDVHVREMYLREARGGYSVKPADPSARVVKLQGAGAINDEGGVIVDSGTTDTYFSRLVSKSLRKNWESLAGMGWDHSKKSMSPEEIAKLPTILIQFAGDEAANKKIADTKGGGDPNKIPGLAGDLDKNFPYDVVVAVSPDHYMESLSDGSVMNRIYDEEDDGTVIGANVMMGHDVFFDAQNMRLGWSESGCDYSELSQSAGYPDVMGGKTGGETAAGKKKDDTEAEKQEEDKETADEVHAGDEIEQDNANIEELAEEGDFDDDGNGNYQPFTKTKYNKTLEIPLDGIVDNPGITGVVVAFVFMMASVCVFKCCCTPRRARRRQRKRSRKEREIELQGRNDGGFRDEVSEGSDDDSDDDEDDNMFDDAEEYGEMKVV